MGLMDRFADPELFHSLSFGQKMAGSAVTMLMGMGITFCILLILWGFIAVMGSVMNAGKKQSAKDTPEADELITPVKPPAAPAADKNDEALVAVIAAAVAAYEGSGSSGDLVVRRIKRISKATDPWTSAAREDCIESRQF